MVQQAAHVPLHSAAPLRGGGDRCCSNQQAAAAWAWFERSGATCITPRRAEGLHGASRAKTAVRPASRFKKEFMASLDLPNSLGMGPGSGSWRPRRHSFHGESVRREGGEISSGIGSVRDPASPRTGTLLDRQHQVHFGDIVGLNGDDDDDDAIDRVGSTLLDKFELESVWRQVRRHGVSASSSSMSEESNTYSLSYRPNYDAHESPADAASSHIWSKWGGAMRRGGSGHHDRRPPGGGHGRSPSKDDHHPHGGTAPPSFLHQILRLGVSKSASSPALCSSVATANSIRDHRIRPYPSGQLAKGATKHPEKLLYMQSSAQSKDARMRSLVRLDVMDGSREEELAPQYHNHRHIHHHHHHHHHHLLHHTGKVDAVLLKHISSKDGLSQKLHESLEIKELLKHPHYNIERINGGRPQYGHLQKKEGKANIEYLHPSHSEYKDPSPLSCKPSRKSHHALL